MRILLITYQEVLTASAQKYLSKEDSLNMVLASSSNDLFFLSKRNQTHEKCDLTCNNLEKESAIETMHREKNSI